MKLTGWYSGNQKPVRSGVYERQIFTYSVTYSYFSTATGRWSYYKPTVVGALLDKDKVSEFQYKPWRGVAK